MMKPSAIASLSVALALAACNDATAPTPVPAAEPAPPDVATLTASTNSSAVWSDSSAFWTAGALEDAATRLSAEIADEGDRGALRGTLTALAAQIERGDTVKGTGLYDAARRHLTRLLDAGDPSVVPALEAIELALDQAASHVSDQR